MGRYRSSPSRLKDQAVSPVWEKVLTTMHTWMDSQDAHRETNGEDDAILEQVYENEWAAVEAVRSWLGSAKAVGLRTSELDEEETEALDQLVMTSQLVHYAPDGHEDLPFLVVLFMPIALWNDDQSAENGVFVQRPTGSLMTDLAPAITPMLERRLKECWVNTTKQDVYEVECSPTWNLDKVKVVLESGATHVYTPHTMDDRAQVELQDDDSQPWLRAGVMPVLVRGASFESVSGLDFNADQSFDEATEDMRSERWMFSTPMPFMEAVVEADRSRWDLWAKTLLEGPLTKHAVTRNTEFVVHLRDKWMESVSATVRDLSAKGDVLQTWNAERKLDGPQDWSRVLHSWTMVASLAFRWSVTFALAPDKVIVPSFDGIRHAREIRMPSGTTVH